MKRNIINIILVAIMVVGLSLLLYPTFSEYINSRHQSRVIKVYTDAVADISKQQSDEMIKKAQEYNELLAKTPDAFFHPEKVPGYDETLDITGTGIMGFVSIDKINVELPIYHGVSDGVLQIAVGHLPGTSLPAPGLNTHTVLSGHRGLPSAKLFSDLNEIEVGDVFQINILKEQYTYRVDQILIVLPNEVEALQIEPDKEYCTLMTCTPYGVNSHRLLVRGYRTDIAKEGDANYVINDVYQIDPLIVMPVVAAPMIAIWFVVLVIRHFRKKRHEKIRQKGLNIRDKE